MKNENIASQWEKQRKKLVSFAKDLPELPGVYFMHGVDEEILYIGKVVSDDTKLLAEE